MPIVELPTNIPETILDIAVAESRGAVADSNYIKSYVYALPSF